MFVEECKKVRKALYGVRAITQEGGSISWSNGTGFMVYSEIVITAGHLAHIDNNFSKPVHKLFHLINALDIGKSLTEAKLVGEDPERDIAILKILKPSHKEKVLLNKKIVEVGSECGSLGFPLSEISLDQANKKLNFHLVERFQGANISAFSKSIQSGKEFSFYETDSLMYRASSGCPGFTAGGVVFGMHTRSIIDKPRTNQNDGSNKEGNRVSISLWVPSTDIIAFAKSKGIKL